MALITAAEARAYLTDLSGTGEDAALEVVIARVGEQIAAFCGYPPATVGAAATMESTAYTRYYSPAKALLGGVFHLGIYPVTTLTSVYDDPDEAYGAATEVTSDDRTLAGSSGRILLKPTGTHAWSRYGERTLKVTFTAGYTTIPPGLKDAAGRATRDAWRNRPTAANASTADPMRGSISHEVAALLQPYRLPASYGVGYQGEP